MHVCVIMVPLNSMRLQTTFHAAYQKLEKPEWNTEHSKHPIYYPLKAVSLFLIPHHIPSSIFSIKLTYFASNYTEDRKFKPVTQ